MTRRSSRRFCILFYFIFSGLAFYKVGVCVAVLLFLSFSFFLFSRFVYFTSV